MIHSMTAYASLTGSHDTATWAWDMRGVNARGLDLRLRIPDTITGLEPAVRKAIARVAQRGNITLTLRLTREEAGQPLTIAPAQLDAVLAALDHVQDRAFEMGVTLAQPTAADVLAQRGVMVAANQPSDDTDLTCAIMAQVDDLIAGFMAMRRTEGTALGDILAGQIDQIAALTARAKLAAADRREDQAAQLKTAIARISATDVDPDRLAQEVALLALKADVTEEIDRLEAHVAAARDLLDQGGPIGRKLDFLSQEFNREANTLCAKSGAVALTAIGLDLKAVIDQMREQIQNVE